MARSIAVAVLASASLVVACSSTKTVYVDGGAAASGAYTIKFPSTAAAVATDTVQVFVFQDTGDGGAGTCFSLVQKRQSHQALPTALITSDPITPCEMAAGTGAVTIPFGKVAVLAVAVRKGSDFLLGCEQTELSQANPSIEVDLSLASTSVSVPTTVCTSLSSHCTGGCN